MIKIKSRKIGIVSDFGEVISRVQSLLAIENPLAGAFSEAEATNIESIENSATKVNSSKKGSLLLELLIAISILAVVLSVGSQAVFVSMQSGKVSSESDVGMSLASEALEATRAVADEKWQNVYTLTKGSPYHPVQSGENKWTLAVSNEAIALNTANYTRSVTISNVSRDPSTRMIETTYDSAHDDPSTQQVVATVSWQGSGSPITMSDYLLRWRNKACNQTGWSGGKTYPSDPAPTEASCPQSLTTYYNDDGNIDNTVPGSLKLK